MNKKVFKSFKQFILFFIIILFLSSLASASELSFPKPVGYINDFADIIDASYRNKINDLIGEIEKNTSAEIAVVTVKSLEGYSIEDYAVKLFENWGIGKKNKDNGLLILVSLEDRKYRIEVGFGLEGAITDGVAGRIGRSFFVPNFKRGEYGKGIYEAIVALKPYITGESVGIDSPSDSSIFSKSASSIIFLMLSSSIIYGIILFIFLKRIYRIKKRRTKVLLMALPWIIPFFPLLIGLLSLMFILILLFPFLLVSTIFAYVAFLVSSFSKHGNGHHGPFGGFGGGIGGFGGGSSGGGGFGGGGSGGGGASGGW